jgi:hypothetical protein
MRGPMRIASFQRWFLRLSLAATLALALVPTLGRIAQASEASPAQAWTAMCTVAGLVQVAVDPALDVEHARHPGAPADHAGQGDCAYCPLLQALQVPQAALAVVPPALRPQGPQIASRSVDIPFRHPVGLGSRGPPVLT